MTPRRACALVTRTRTAVQRVFRQLEVAVGAFPHLRQPWGKAVRELVQEVELQAHADGGADYLFEAMRELVCAPILQPGLVVRVSVLGLEFQGLSPR